MVAMNPQTWDQDLQEIEPGGYLLYDSTKPMPPSRFRPDVHVIGVPLTDIARRQVRRPARAPAAEEHHLRRRAGGAARHRAGSDRAAARRAVQGQGQADQAEPRRLRDRAALRERAPRRRARPEGRAARQRRRPHLHRGQRGRRARVPSTAARRSAPGIRSRRRRRWPRRSRSTAASYASTRQPARNKFAIVQAEDELASIGMVIGAGWNGARAFTATSGPGVSLMTEFIGLAYFAEIPVTIINVQRGGPSTGMPTRTQQSDLLACAYASHGDTKHVLLFPEDPHECFEFTARRARPRRPAADADLRDDRPRHRHEPPAVRAARLGRQPALRPRQGDERDGSRRRQGLRPLPRRRRRRHPLPHPARHASDAGRLLHARHDQGRATRATPRPGPTTCTTWSGC